MSGHFEHIKYKVFSGKEPGPHLLITAGVHGDEYEPVFAVKDLVKIARNNITRGKLTLVPVVNRPAFQRACRTGSDGLDVARICPGRRDGTPSEKIAAEISQLIREADYLIDLHTGGNAFSISPLCGYMLHQSEEVLDKQRKMAYAFNLPVIWGTNAMLNGRTLSIARDAGVPGIYTEFGGGGRIQNHIIQAYVQGCLNILGALNMMEEKLPPDKVQYFVEDNRLNSGLLQIMLPAPAKGLFEKRIELGSMVKKGQLIGNITSEFGEPIAQITSDIEGMVFMLRTIPFVTKGDALGGILPIIKPGKVKIN